MNISSVIQKHYHRDETLLIYNSIDAVRSNFAKLAMTGIVHGNRWNPFTTFYKFKVRWDGNAAYLDGPYGMKMSRLVTKITLQPSINRDLTTLDLSIEFSLRDINIWLIFMLFSVLLICFISGSLFTKLIFLVIIEVFSYGLGWVYFYYSMNIVLECLPRELSTVVKF
jgi:hypothetical protein